MRTFLITLTGIFPFLSFSQNADTKAMLADSGKYEFKRQAKRDTPDYSIAYRILSNEVKQNPNSAELHYFLGYAITRLNADDAKTMKQQQKELTIKASEQFEEVNKIEPVYKGEIYILDPYSKISAIWGSLAEAYLNRNFVDSARWAFEEGKKRGGFIEPILEVNRQLLNSCENNSILITVGDNVTISLWYLQLMENCRNDVTIIDANMIGTNWYPKYLKHQRHLNMSLDDVQLDTIEYEAWKPTIVDLVNAKDTSQKYSWELRGTYMDGYILKGDRILLDILQQNYFSRTIYFNMNSDSSYNLFLSRFLSNEGLMDRLYFNPTVDYLGYLTTLKKNLSSYSMDHIKQEDIIKSNDAVKMLNSFRWAYYICIFRAYSSGNNGFAISLIEDMKRKFPKDKLPYTSKEIEDAFDEYFKSIDKNY